jgi:hypothetical protein
MLSLMVPACLLQHACYVAHSVLSKDVKHNTPSATATIQIQPLETLRKYPSHTCRRKRPGCSNVKLWFVMTGSGWAEHTLLQ